MYEQFVLDRFKSVIAKKTDYDFSMVEYGIVTDFHITDAIREILKEKYSPINVTTLFTVDERMNSSVESLIQKQILHYIEVYGLNTPGLFNLETTSGSITSFNFIKAITIDEVKNKIQNILYSNFPIANTEEFRDVIKHFDVSYDINLVKNNELKMLLYNGEILTNGDDVVRYIVYHATDSALLIKDEKTIDAVSSKPIYNRFLMNHMMVLSEVFNRHKKIIMALKNKNNKSIINKISKQSKSRHVPVYESISKTFISKALSGQIDAESILKKVTIRDKFKFLNLLEYKMKNNTTDVFIIRNGKVHVEPNRKVYNKTDITNLISLIIESLKIDLSFLKNKSILLDSMVDYGLPISNKQAMGNLPFGTTVSVDGNISSGIYWENSGGATDLDLSAISMKGERIGWGNVSGYNNSDIIFSGDVTYAENGAMEFMTSSSNYNQSYGLFVNIYSGNIGSKAQLVIGNQAKGKWIDSVKIRESITLNSRGNIIGFVRNGKFVVYQGRIGGSCISGSDKDRSMINRGDVDFWTVKKLFDALDIEYDCDKKETSYDIDLTYSAFSYNGLMEVFEKTC